MKMISVVLFDADGVLQRAPEGWMESWGQLIDDENQVEEFLEELFVAERPFLGGGEGLEDAVEQVLKKWSRDATFQDVLDLWNQIEVSETSLQIVKSISDLGYQVAMATNQQIHRFNYMMSQLYPTTFDFAFASYQLGVTKPSESYFHHVLHHLNLPASEILFFDDSAANVSSAKALGINAHEFQIEEGQERLLELLGIYGISPG